MELSLIVIAYLKVRPGKRVQFEEFERQAFRLIEKHGGELLHALHPIASLPAGELPDEVHILRFPSQDALDEYRADPALLALADLRAEAIAGTNLLIGTPLVERVGPLPA